MLHIYMYIRGGSRAGHKGRLSVSATIFRRPLKFGPPVDLTRTIVCGATRVDLADFCFLARDSDSGDLSVL